MKKISLVIPSYNEELNVSRFFEESEKAFSKSGYEIEYVYVNDGSRDGTFDALEKLYKENNSNFRIISFSRNFGKEAAIYAGLSNATGDYTVIIDADLQQRPEVVLKMAEILDSKPETDCVAAFQEKRKESKLLVFFKNRFYSYMNRITDLSFVSGAGDFRIFRRNVRDAILSLGEYHRFSKGIFPWVGFETEFIPYEVMKRESGRSKWSFKKLFRYAVDGIVSYSVKPLYLATVLGAVSVIVSVLYYIVGVILGVCGIGWFELGFILATIVLMGGMIMICMGIMGEYLSKIHLQSKDRPVYIAKHILKKDKE